MPVSHRHKTIFVHIPKTGGTFLEQQLGMHGNIADVGLKRYLNQQANYDLLFGAGLQHLTASQIKSKLGSDIYHNYFKFSVVRNPFDRLVSFVAWLGGKWERKEELSVDEFRNYICPARPRLLSRRRMPIPQYRFITKRHKPLVDVVLHFESLSDELHILEQKLGLTIVNEIRMKSYHQTYGAYYDEASYQFVKRYYQKDFHYFQYSDQPPWE